MSGFTAVVLMALFFFLNGAVLAGMGFRFLRKGEAWNRIAKRPMTQRELKWSVSWIFIGAVCSLLGAVLMVVVLIVGE